MDNKHSPEQIWQTALGQLQTQMTQATFDTWVKNTWVISAEEGVWQIGTKSAFAKDWLENRLFTVINRTVTNILGGPIELKFVVQENGNDAAATVSRVELLPGDYADFSPTPPTTTTQPSSFNPPPAKGLLAVDIRLLNKTGYLPLPNYYPRFIRPYLQNKWRRVGQEAFAVWEQLLAMDEQFFKEGFCNWTKPFIGSITDLAEELDTTIEALTGRYGYCKRVEQAQKQGNPLTQRCADCKRSECEFRGHDCRYWRPGILEVLSAEEVGFVEESGGRKNHQIKVQVWRSWPIRSPYQVKTYFSPAKQRQHQNWLLKKASKIGFTPEDWAAEMVQNGIEQFSDRNEGRECWQIFIHNSIRQDKG